MKRSLTKLFLLFILISTINKTFVQEANISKVERDSLLKILTNMINNYHEYSLPILYGTKDKNEITKFSESKFVNRSNVGLDNKTIYSINFIRFIFMVQLLPILLV